MMLILHSVYDNPTYKVANKLTCILCRDNTTHCFVTRTSSMKKLHASLEPGQPTPTTVKKETEEASGQQSRARLDAQLWLQCRHALVSSMVGEIRGMGLVKGRQKLG